ncbi:regulator of nonsense transcripts UPF3-like isoform X1 [Juglans microcarpa x Juglans regia]|uniref:regulator of nonsense transcripts UPF3-like isoform X1 n=2 Tax=Juglans microcarpa x Juglans regia TaxID=2249226 RepID=UPI001B7E942E|nr:regulator of nonsense transcripts UPF3-like isoform X1 [Juglans microcarpa x Juglans regia]XP_041010282.1 regulator of nonsense transcripts UPF3-like isoform X1 [Juglans microcarpa x Juglans regia]
MFSVGFEMKGSSDRTKVVLRHLPPAISQETLMDQIDAFADRYHWVTFRPGKPGTQHQSYSRAYLDFKKPEDVIEFADFFDGHLFVNEKGIQFKTIVEYAPSQRVPKQWSKKDGREGTILKDTEYLEFLEFLAKPVENLPSAEIQLERREAERGGVLKDAPVVTPLMDFVRQKRAAKGGSRRSLSNGKMSRRAARSLTGSPSSSSSKRGSARIRMSSTMYVLRDAAKNMSVKDKSTYILVPKRDDEQLSDKAVTLVPAAGTELLAEESGISGTNESGKKKLLLKGKEREISHVSGSLSQQQGLTSSAGNTIGSAALKQNQQRQGGGRIVRRILLNKDSRQNQSFLGLSEQQIQTSNLEKDKRPPRPPHVQSVSKDTIPTPDDKVVGKDLHRFFKERQEKHSRNKDKPDRGVWTSLRRLDGSNVNDESLVSSASQLSLSPADSSEGSHGDVMIDMPNARSGGVKSLVTGRTSHSSLENGSHKHFGRRGPAHGVKDVDGSSTMSEGKLSRKGTSYNSHEKQVWIQKQSSGS